MSQEGIIDLLTFPEVPLERRPQRIYIDYFVDAVTKEALNGRGYEVIDVRSLPNSTDGDRAEAVKAYLEGIRLRTILPGEATARYVELEARIYGLLDAKNRRNNPDEGKLGPDILDQLKGFKSKFAQGKITPARKKK